MKIFEVLNFEKASGRYPYTIKQHGNNAIRASFNTENNQIIDVLIVIYGKDQNQWDISFATNGEYFLTGGGNQLKIFNTVFHFISEALQRSHKPRYITFTADKKEPSRIKFYNTIIRKLAPRYLSGFVPVANSGLGRITLPGNIKWAEHDDIEQFILKNTRYEK
jgi:hypothetical protein